MKKTNALKNVKQLAVFMGGRKVGTMAETPDGLAAFQYTDEWLQHGYSISPISLPLEKRVFVPQVEPFDGLFGVFQDSLPDGWGALLLDRMIRVNGNNPGSVTPMTKLAIVGSTGRGGLRYKPELSFGKSTAHVDNNLDNLANICKDILEDKPIDDLDEAYALGGSSAGARPKAYLTRDGISWLIKFPSSIDPPDVGKMEYEYSLAAQECGIDMPQTRLFKSAVCPGYFGTRRFDRDAHGNGIHMVTASGMLEVSHRTPLLDYRHLFQLTEMLSDDIQQAWNLFRLMCFNVFAHNQDDHSNNFAWLYKDGQWRLAPAYDLTYSTSFGNEHATTVLGNGNPTFNDVVSLGEEAGLPRREVQQVANIIEKRCSDLLKTLNLA